MTDERDISNIQFIDEKERLYFAQAQLGDEAIRFLKSPIGRYLKGRAKQELDEAREEALTCNADSFFGRRKLKKVQARAAMAEQFTRWMIEVITEGENAAHELENYRD